MSQIAFFIGSFSIYWFGIIIAVALLAATAVAVLCRKMQGKDSRAVLFVAGAGSFLSLYLSCIVHWYCCDEQYESFMAAVSNIKEGGFSILGVFIGSVLAVFLAKLIGLEKDAASLFDCIAPGGALGISIGRLGAMFTSSDKGKVIIDHPLFQRLPFAVQVNEGSGEWQLATFAFESFAAAVGFFICLTMFSRIYSGQRGGVNYRHGDAALIFTAFYGATQAVLESTRYDALFMRSNGFVSMMQVLSSIALVAVLVVFSVRAVKSTGYTQSYLVTWISTLLLIVAAMMLEYLVQRNGEKAVLFYACMIVCMMSVFFTTLKLYRISVYKSEVGVN